MANGTTNGICCLCVDEKGMGAFGKKTWVCKRCLARAALHAKLEAAVREYRDTPALMAHKSQAAWNNILAILRHLDALDKERGDDEKL